MKVLEKNRAIELRRQGRTFREIRDEVVVSKGSLSAWLRGVALTPTQLARINYKNEIIKKKFIQYNSLKKKRSADEKKETLSHAASEIRTISSPELKLIGIALYWAEGYKGAIWNSVSFTNSDPDMIEFMMRWFREVCGVAEDRFRIKIHCHDPQAVDLAEEFWSKLTNIPRSQFSRPYIKTSPTSKGKSGLLCPYGICHIRISDTLLLTKIKGWIKGLAALSSSPV